MKIKISLTLMIKYQLKIEEYRYSEHNVQKHIHNKKILMKNSTNILIKIIRIEKILKEKI